MLNTVFSSASGNELAKLEFIQHCNDMLRCIDPTNQANFDHDIWVIPFTRLLGNENIHLFATLNFTDFKNTALMFKDQFSIQLENNQSVDLNLLGFAKWLFLKLKCNGSIDYRSVWLLDVLKMHFTFLAERRSTVLNDADLEEFFSLLLTHDFKNGAFIKRFGAPAYASRFKCYNLMDCARILRSHGIDDFIGEFDHSDINKAFNESCLAQIDMTLSDYKAGGSFDFLTLDVGRHYVDFCATFFEENIAFSIALSRALFDVRLKVSEDGKKDLWTNYFNKSEILNKSNVLVQNFRFHYNNIAEQTHAFCLSTINKIAVDLGLDEERFDTYEFIRSLLYTRFYDSELKKREYILAEYLASLKNESTKNTVNFTLSEFDIICNNQLLNAQLSETESVDVMLRHIDKYDLVNRKSVRKYFLDVESAGITALVAFTGWRASEYGFPLSALRSEVNRDIKDAVYTPFRFHLKWISPKTNGETLLEREITLSTNVLIRQIDSLTQHAGDEFAITSTPRTDSNDINRIVYNAVVRHWLNFPSQYLPFKELTELQYLESSEDHLTATEKNRFIELKNKYNLENRMVKELLQLKDKLINDVKLQKFASRLYKVDDDNVRFKDVIVRFIKGTLPITDSKLIESKLSIETLDAIKSPDFDLTENAILSIRVELLNETYYATPHALRHIWAEAVLRRYKGDVGKFIRANFKHIDERFFMAYLKNKEARSIMQVAKRTTINSIVENRINSLGDEKRAYSGGFDRFINKAVRITKVYSQQEFNNLFINITENRIVDIKTNAWATCILRTSTQNLAKCSVDGIPQRYNASPKLCLGCINADIEAGNFYGIVVYVKPDIDACRNPHLPLFLKEVHLDNVKKALKRVIELEDGDTMSSRYRPFINYLLETIEIVNNSNGIL
jgi:hypothetical protein